MLEGKSGREWEIKRATMGVGVNDRRGVTLGTGVLHGSGEVHGGNNVFEIKEA